MPYKNIEDRRRYQRVWIAKRREEYFEDKDCATCHSTERLELDHKDPSKKVSHKIWSWCKARREAELKKCQILCHNCHLKKTAKDVKKMRTHGTVDCYVRYHCRCDECMKVRFIIKDELRRYEDYSGNPNEKAPTIDSEEEAGEADERKSLLKDLKPFFA